MCEIMIDWPLSVIFRNASADGPEEKSEWRETSGWSQSDGLHTHHCTDSGQFSDLPWLWLIIKRQTEGKGAVFAGADRDTVCVGGSVSLGGL